jgi:hypothetical protein
MAEFSSLIHLPNRAFIAFPGGSLAIICPISLS